jgi:hypothetical protein
MEGAIVEKLRQQLRGCVDTECQVVYILCQIRKLLDKKPPDPNPFALRLYCHWALHVDLSHRSTTLPFLDKVDSFVFNALIPGHRTKENLLAEYALFRDFVYLEAFRKELSQVLAAYNLPLELCGENARWFTFLAAYASVIEDGSLACENRGSDKLKMVEKVTFTKGPQKMADSHVPFGIMWNILLKDRRRLEVEVATQADPKFIYHGLRLVNG